MQVNIQEVGFLRAMNIPGVQRTLQDSFLIEAFERRPAEARNHLYLPEQLQAEDNGNEQMPAAFLPVQPGSKFELSYSNAMLQWALHKQMRLCLQYFAQHIPEQQIFLKAVRSIGGSKPYPMADTDIQNAFLLLCFQSTILWLTSQEYHYV